MDPQPSDPPDGIRTSLNNIGILLALVVVMLLGLGLMLALGTFADQNVDKVQMRLKSQRENRRLGSPSVSAPMNESP